MADDAPPPFPEAPHGYEREAVERFVEAAERRRGELEDELEAACRERAALEHELVRVRGELDATKAAMPEMGELQARLEGLEGDYAERIRALEAFLASAVREVAERCAEAGSSRTGDAAGGPVIRGAWSAAPGSDDG